MPSRPPLYRQKEKPDREHQIDGDEHHSLHPVGLSVGGLATDDGDGEDDRHDLKGGEVKIHGFPHQIARKHEHGGHEQCHLRAGPDRDAER